MTNGVSRSSAAPQEPGVQAMAERLEALLAGFDGIASPRQAREQAEELVRTLMGLYGAGIERILSLVHDTLDGRSEAIFDRLCEDKLVEGLLCLHGLHPYSVEERVQRALDSVRPYLKSHEGGIEIVGIQDGVVMLRLQGSCDGCPSSTATVKLAVERAILEQVPEIHEVRAEGVTAGPSALRAEWIALDRVSDLEKSGIAGAVLGGTPVLFVRFDETVYAYRNRCAGCESALDGAAVERPFLTCPQCGRAFDVVHAGRAKNDERLFIEPLPLVRESWRLRVSIPNGA